MASQDDSPSQESETEPLKLAETPVEAVAEVTTPHSKPDRSNTSGYTQMSGSYLSAGGDVSQISMAGP